MNLAKASKNTRENDEVLKNLGESTLDEKLQGLISDTNIIKINVDDKIGGGRKSKKDADTVNENFDFYKDLEADFLNISELLSSDRFKNCKSKNTLTI